MYTGKAGSSARMANTTTTTPHNVRHRAQEEPRMPRSEEQTRFLISRRRRLSGLDYELFEGEADRFDGDNTLEERFFHFIHIPKTSGDSFMADSTSHMPVGVTLQGNVESGYLFSEDLFYDQPNHFSVVFLREPISHVQSQFLECKYDPYFRNRVNKFQFPGYFATDNTMEGFTEWIKYFVNLGNDENSMGATAAHNCYDPWNMQSRYFTSTVNKVEAPHYAFSASDRLPSIKTAKQNLEKVDVVGLVEHYAASLCLFEYHAFGRVGLSKDCQYCDPKTQTLTLVKAHTRHSKHYSPPHSVNMIPEATLQLIKEKLTLVDQELYNFAVDLFHKEVEEVKQATGVDLLCRGNTPNESVKKNQSQQNVPANLVSSKPPSETHRQEYRNIQLTSSFLMEFGVVLLGLVLYFVLPRWRNKVQMKTSFMELPQQRMEGSSSRKQAARA